MSLHCFASWVRFESDDGKSYSQKFITVLGFGISTAISEDIQMVSYLLLRPTAAAAAANIPHYDSSIYTCVEQTLSHTHSPAVIPHGNPHSLILQIFPLSKCQAPRQDVLISHAETTHSLSALHVPSAPQSRKREIEILFRSLCMLA